MKVQTALYYRYLYKKSITILIFSLILIGLINLLMFLIKFKSIQENLITFILAIILWIFPLIICCYMIFYFINWKKSYKQIKDKELYNRINIKNIEKVILKKGMKIKIFMIPKNQDSFFFKIIESEIERQKEIIKIKKDLLNEKNKG